MSEVIESSPPEQAGEMPEWVKEVVRDAARDTDSGVDMGVDRTVVWLASDRERLQAALAAARGEIAELREPIGRELAQFRDLLEKNAELRSRLEIAERERDEAIEAAYREYKRA